MKRLNNKGFTLVEILAVTVILVVIILLATNAFFPLSQKAKKKAFISEIQTYVKGAEAYYQIKDLNSSLEECETIDGDLVCSIDINSLEGEFVKKTDVKNEYNGCVFVKKQDGLFTAYDVLMSNGSFTYSGSASGIKEEEILQSNMLASCDGFSGSDTDGKEEKPGEDTESKEEVPETSDKATLLARSYSDSYENYYAYSSSIIEIEFVKNKEYKDAKLKWNVAQPDLKNGITKDAIIAWLEPSSKNASKYKLYIGSDKEIYAPKNCKYLFEDFYSLQSITFNNFNTSNVENMHGMFAYCYSLTSLDLSGFDTSNVTDMAWMFDNCNALTYLNLSSFNTSSVKDMNHMFQDVNSLTRLDLKSFDTSSVEDISNMFSLCESLISLDLSSFDTSSVEDMSSMISSCKSLTSIIFGDLFDTSNVTDMSYMFYYCEKLSSLDLSDFDTSNVSAMDWMFAHCDALTSLDLSDFDTSSVEDMSGMFFNCDVLTSLDLSNFDTSSVKYMYEMFARCGSLTSLDLSSFDTSSVEDMDEMFASCESLTTLDLGTFDTSNVTDVSYMFYGVNKSLNIYFDDVTSKNNFINKKIEMPVGVDILVGEPNI